MPGPELDWVGPSRVCSLVEPFSDALSWSFEVELVLHVKMADAYQNSPNNAYPDTKHDRRHAETKGLHGMKANERIVLVWFEHEKHDPSDQAESVGERTRQVRREAGSVSYRPTPPDRLRA